MATPYLRLSRARQNYKCAICLKMIKVGVPYFRDEPHPMARRHRAAKTRYLCTNCAVGRDPNDFTKPAAKDQQQLDLPFDKSVLHLPGFLLQTAILEMGNKIDEGQIIEAVTIPWFDIVSQIEKNPAFLFQIPWRRLEEFIAGAYDREGWDEVILTPASRDRGRDIIAVRQGVCRIRIVDQVKAYAPDRYVCANDVRALLGVLSSDLNVSKGFVTTTAKFAPGILEDTSIKPFIPYRLELKDGEALRRWLIDVAKNRNHVV